MRVRFRKNIDVRKERIVNEGDVFEAVSDDKFITVSLPSGRTIQMPNLENSSTVEILSEEE